MCAACLLFPAGNFSCLLDNSGPPVEYMSAYVLLNLLNILRISNKM